MSGEPSSGSIVSRINEILAMRITLLVGSIWAFYAFVIFGLTPLLWPQYEEQILYWSNFLQLIFLPVITVGTAIMSRGTEARAAQDHTAIQREFALLKEMNASMSRALAAIGEDVRKIAARG
jgi:hypothetical protein